MLDLFLYKKKFLANLFQIWRQKDLKILPFVNLILKNVPILNITLTKIALLQNWWNKKLAFSVLFEITVKTNMHFFYIIKKCCPFFILNIFLKKYSFLNYFLKFTLLRVYLPCPLAIFLWKCVFLISLRKYVFFHKKNLHYCYFLK